MNRNDLPLGFSFALAQNPDAMMKFAVLPKDKQSQILEKAHAVTSKDEMQSLVSQLASPLL